MINTSCQGQSPGFYGNEWNGFASAVSSSTCAGDLGGCLGLGFGTALLTSDVVGVGSCGYITSSRCRVRGLYESLHGWHVDPIQHRVTIGNVRFIGKPISTTTLQARFVRNARPNGLVVETARFRRANGKGQAMLPSPFQAE